MSQAACNSTRPYPRRLVRHSSSLKEKVWSRLHCRCAGCRLRYDGGSAGPGCLHPDHEGYFATPAAYLEWYRRAGPLRADTSAPTVAVRTASCTRVCAMAHVHQRATLSDK